MRWQNYPIKRASLGEKEYPQVLSKITNPPKVIYYRGNLSTQLFEKSLGVVGTRRMTNYGREVVARFVSYLAIERITIISGFMYGIDTEAHKKSVEMKNPTIAVFGCGLDEVYPPENEKLYREILETGGAVISEYEPNIKPHLWTFPQRNRIIVGLSSLGILVIEAGENSGSLITASIAFEEKRKVFAVPGAITSSNSSGTNYLIKNGLGQIALGPEDILGGEKKTIKKDLTLGELEEKIIKILEREPATIDEMTVFLDGDLVEISTTLSLMSMKGLVYESAGKFHSKILS